MYRHYFKRIFDLIGSLILLILFLPVLLVLYVVLHFYYKGSPVFYQRRPGLKGKVFKVMKFKSMIDATDVNGTNLPDSVRLTGVGKFLRRTSLDELPQLLNILKGDMSFIGPRPLFERYVPYYTNREQLRHTVRPGITGLAQTSGRNNLDWNTRLELDVVYVENISLRLDIEIFFKTVINVFKGKDVVIIPGSVYDPLDVERKKRHKDETNR